MLTKCGIIKGLWDFMAVTDSKYVFKILHMKKKEIIETIFDTVVTLAKRKSRMFSKYLAKICPFLSDTSHQPVKDL